MQKTKQILTNIKSNTEQYPEEIILSRKQIVSNIQQLQMIMDDLDDEIGILENRHAEDDREECLAQLATSST